MISYLLTWEPNNQVTIEEYDHDQNEINSDKSLYD